jgi:electron transport complex protein RnfB
MSTEQLTNKIDALLQQTQCEQCGYKGCKPYAKAIAAGEATIDLCAPGGVDTLNTLAHLLDVDPTPYIKHVEDNYRAPSVAYIDEDLCIGCMKCIHVCPVDAIVGTAKMMHTIIRDECTGCELCIPACPMDCIHLSPLPPRSEPEQQEKTTQWRRRYNDHNARLARERRAKQEEHQAAKRNAKKQAIAEALARVKAKRESS